MEAAGVGHSFRTTVVSRRTRVEFVASDSDRAIKASPAGSIA